MILCTFFLFSCIAEDLEECFNVQITYRYTREGTTKNIYHGYIHSLNEYIFDNKGILCKVNTLPMNKSISTHKLLPGEYSLISWANQDNISKISNINVGETNKEELLMYLDKQINTNSEKLFYSYRTFRINTNGISYIHSDMVQAYCLLNMSIRWRSNPPDNSKDLYLVYKQVPYAYSSIPSFVFEKNSWSAYAIDADDYPNKSDDKIYYTPNTLTEENMITYRQDIKINVDKKVNATFITYRYRNDSPLLLSLYWGDEQIMKEIGLERFFREMKIDLNKTLFQEYDIEIEIDGDNVNVSFVNINDWGEGGVIN